MTSAHLMKVKFIFQDSITHFARIEIPVMKIS